MILRTSYAWVLLVPVLAGCPLLKKKGADPDADASVTAAAVAEPVAAPPPAPLGANEKAVARYPDEKLDRHEATINFAVANVSDASGGGQVLAGLKKGTRVNTVAEHSKQTLIVFKDPSNAKRDLMGWVNTEVFGPEPKRVPKRLRCGSVQIAVLLESGDDRCVTPCRQDSDCGGDATCDGDGVASDNGQPGRDVEFCIAAKAVPKKARTAVCNNDAECSSGSGGSAQLFCIRHNRVQTCELLNFGICPPGETGLDGIRSDGQSATFCGKGAVATVTPAPPPPATTAGVQPEPAKRAPAPKVRCVLPSAPPCASPHVQSPKGLCQVACPTGDCSSCDGNCQAGFCVPKS